MGRPTNAETIEEENADTAWRVELLRALTVGSVPDVERVVLAHIEVLSAPFTASMPTWSLQWEGMHWWMLQNATPLFVASAYSQPEVVRWLLVQGADRTARSYLKQTPSQVVGECCAHAAIPDTRRDAQTIAVDSAECTRLLAEPPLLPFPPSVGIAFESSFSSEVIVRSATSMASSLQQTVYKCLLHVTWQTPLSNGALIEKYELRYRRLVAEEEDEKQHDEDAAGDDEDDEDDEEEEEDETVDTASISWRIECVGHNRKKLQQTALMEGLQFSAVYEFMLRSWSAAGKGEWSHSCRTKTRAAPSQTR